MHSVGECVSSSDAAKEIDPIDVGSNREITHIRSLPKPRFLYGYTRTAIVCELCEFR
jgi:hypothetical protein